MRSPPRSTGATYTSSSSASPSRTNEAATEGPPSTNTRCTPRRRRSASRPASPPDPVSPAYWRNARGCRRSAAVSGTAREPTTTGTGWDDSSDPSSARAVRAGSSASTVPVPATMASARARRAWTSARATGPVIHWLVPSDAAARPSRLCAHFTVTCGRPRRCTVSQESRSAVASAADTPDSTSTPAARRRSAPPEEWSPGSPTAYTTRETPAAMRASAHGPVRPVWLHGSRVTTAVAPWAAPGVSCDSASTSACGVPAPRCHPSARTSPSRESSTAPTCGLTPRGPRAASSSARRIASCSAALAIGPSFRRRSRRSGGTGSRGARNAARAASHPD